MTSKQALDNAIKAASNLNGPLAMAWATIAAEIRAQDAELAQRVKAGYRW